MYTGTENFRIIFNHENSKKKLKHSKNLVYWVEWGEKNILTTVYKIKVHMKFGVFCNSNFTTRCQSLGNINKCINGDVKKK